MGTQPLFLSKAFAQAGNCYLQQGKAVRRKGRGAERQKGEKASSQKGTTKRRLRRTQTFRHRGGVPMTKMLYVECCEVNLEEKMLMSNISDYL